MLQRYTWQAVNFTLNSFVRARLSTLCLLNARLEDCGRKLKARLYDSETCLHLASLAAAKANDLAVLLQLGDELITLLDDVAVLLVLIVGSVSLDNALDAIDGAGDAVSGDKFREIPG